MATEQDHESKALMALRKAVAKALERKRRLGQYAVVWRDGQMVRLAPEQIGSAEAYESGGSAPPSAVREPGPDDEDPK
ncbi:hypothetical protein [Thioalkalivibrio halophilus]|uniref:Uncharacterized protein n=1 Tax=Thioalkalivibrio halophilus TaxID=252474 RepID=A0A1V2ZVE5_9GAMM|nr:hypothetical protein [Thioalkalivibrio halophilus]OOC09079.1 hypothetical protein B1A74_12765 [Thioalkalivibrio halophilus]